MTYIFHFRTERQNLNIYKIVKIMSNFSFTKEICGFPLRRGKQCKNKYKKKVEQISDIDRDKQRFCHLHRNKELPPSCTICLSYVMENKMQTKCDHVFHQECLSEHILGFSTPVCPNCRTPIEDVYTVSTFQIGIPLLHIIQNTSEKIVEENPSMKKQTKNIISSLALQWIGRMKQSGQQLVALHVENYPFEDFTNIVNLKFPGSEIIDEMKIILVCPHSSKREIIWP